MQHILVTAYYPLPGAKHPPHEYREWYTNFFTHVTCPVVCFCPKSMEEEFSQLKKQNVALVVREFDSWNMMSPAQMDIWKQFHTSDPEKGHHCPDLYAIWAAKQEFVLEAMKLTDGEVFTWCDIGCFRTKRNGSFEFVERYYRPGKITCLSICEMIGGGVLMGDRTAWTQFSKLFLDELSKNPHGKDQVIYKRILNSENAVIINPVHNYGDYWFYLTYIFCYPIQHHEQIL
jgi:hypothetical protein